MSEEFTHTRYVEEDKVIVVEPPKPPVAIWPFGTTYLVHCEDKHGEKFKYELTEHSAQASIQAVREMYSEVVRALALVK